jgi:hypothetical protein
MHAEDNKVASRCIAIKRAEIGLNVLAIYAAKGVKVHNDDLATNKRRRRRGIKPVVSLQDSIDRKRTGLRR